MKHLKACIFMVSLMAAMLCACQTSQNAQADQGLEENIVGSRDEWKTNGNGNDVGNEEGMTDENGQAPDTGDGMTADGRSEEGAGGGTGETITAGSIVAEDEAFLYLCSPYQITKVDKSDLQSEILWESAEESYRSRTAFYQDGRGILIGEKIYFLEEWARADGGGSGVALSVVGTDGSGYRRIQQVKARDLFLYKDVLYVYLPDEKEMLEYPVLADGTLSEQDALIEGRKIPEAYTAVYYSSNGTHAMQPLLILQEQGYCLMENGEYALVKYFVDGTEEKLEEAANGLEGYTLDAWNDAYWLMHVYDDQKEMMIYELVDAQTYEKYPVMEFVGSVGIITMDEESVYFMREVSEGERPQAYLFEKADLKSGERTILFEQEPFTGLGVNPSKYLFDYVVENGYLYYMEMQDYKLYMMRRSLEEPETAEALGTAFYDSRIGEAGTIASVYREFFAEDVLEGKTEFSEDTEELPDMSGEAGSDAETIAGKEEPCFILDLTWLLVKESYPGAEKINAYMQSVMDENIQYAWEGAEESAQMREEYETYAPPAYSLSSNVYEITYVDDAYLSYCQGEYIYWGGAHGMPDRTGYTFDLQTGECLTLPDVVGNSEEELKEIVGRYYEELISQTPESYWEDSVEYIKEDTDYETDFYLTAEGIRFFREPYEIAAYASGFPEVTIPYSEFEMKIPVETAQYR